MALLRHDGERRQHHCDQSHQSAAAAAASVRIFGHCRARLDRVRDGVGLIRCLRAVGAREREDRADVDTGDVAVGHLRLERDDVREALWARADHARGGRGEQRRATHGGGVRVERLDRLDLRGRAVGGGCEWREQRQQQDGQQREGALVMCVHDSFWGLDG